MGKYFGTDGFRGEANVTLKPQQAFRIGQFLGNYFGGKHRARVVIGKDTRASGDMLENALAAGLNASGADAYLMHVTTTPSVAYVTRTEGFDCGIMISASHNPFYDNGIKLISKSGRKMDASVEDAIEKYLDDSDSALPLARRETIGRTVDDSAARETYIRYLESVPLFSFQNTKVGLDCANGSASGIAAAVFEKLGSEVHVIHNKPNGININDHCGSTHIESLAEFVKERHLDLGFAYDGDADRCFAVDENGGVVDGDRIIFICAKRMKEQGNLAGNTVVTTVMSNLGLYKACDSEGIRYEQTAVGDKYVAENMFANGYSIGGEQSGHIIFSEHGTTGDGILTSLMVMDAVLAGGRKLSELASEVKLYPQVLKNIRVRDKKAVRENAAVSAETEKIAAELGGEGRILVRESGTEPLIRIMIEAGDEGKCAFLAERVADVIRKEGLAEE